MKPAQATCRTRLPDGTLLTITATRRERAGRADVKCTVPGDAYAAERMQQVVRLARHTESLVDSRDQVVLGADRPPVGRDWELAAVLADRIVRGVWHAHAHGGDVVANGWSDAWELGRVAGHDVLDASPDALVGGPDGLAHLGQLDGHPDPGARVSSARAWFPLHSGGADDALGWVEVSVHPLAPTGERLDEELTIAVPGVDAARQLAVRQALAGARHFDGRGLGRWRTTVRFGAPPFAGRSYELALVLADRIARGREFLPRARLLATGCSDAWHAGRVDTVDGLAPKCALLLREAGPGDRILLPQAWEDGLPDGFAGGVRARGASMALVGRIGII
jgi:hypothetical protein